ncbi:MAG: SDR family oxidoreductase [Actinobacteria bacterium]|nr:SDR family oxidoreductase [Actinomycetota bacterium]
MELGLTGKTAAVAAGTAGLGLGTAKALAVDGVRVLVCGRDENRLQKALVEIGHGAIGFVCDVSTDVGGREFAERAIAMLGSVDILVANGGGPPPGGFAQTPEAQYLEALQKNLLSVVAMCQVAVPPMRERGWGRVLAITSVAVRQPMNNLILSNTARAGVTGFLKTLAREVAGDGVTVNSIQPGTHATDRITQLYGANPDVKAMGIPAGVMGDADDFGRIGAFMCSDSAKFMTGVQLHIDGGSYAGLL